MSLFSSLLMLGQSPIDLQEFQIITILLGVGLFIVILVYIALSSGQGSGDE